MFDEGQVDEGHATLPFIKDIRHSLLTQEAFRSDRALSFVESIKMIF